MKLKKTKIATRILNCVSSKGTHKNWGIDVAASIGAIGDANPPASVDLREDSWWQVGDQGQTGACVGWALADGVLRWHFVKANRLAHHEKMAVRQVWLSAKETDVFDFRPTTFIEEAGTSLKAALDVALDHGVVKESKLPFTGNRFIGSEDEFYGMAAERKVKRYFDLQRNLNEWRKWISQNGPLLTRLDVDSSWMNVDGTGQLESYDYQSTSGGHAVAIVGYTPDYFIVRNSWGKNWGDGGYAYASNDYAYRAFTEIYGVAV